MIVAGLSPARGISSAMSFDQITTLFTAAVAIIVLEAWRRSLKGRTPRWIHVTAIVLEIEVAVGAAYAQYRLFEAASSIGSDEGGNKATNLARGVSAAMNSNAFAVAGFCLTVVVLFIGAFYARK